ncbi:hypothetical protein GH733_015608 [Mirounga leonina]|nr:hypothetical protein GH733_015608 [Mirounga leonina]
MWPEELIALGPGESAWHVVLKKIQELSDSDHREPFVVASLGVLASRHQAFCRALPRVSPFYAVKCCNSTWVLRVLATLGTGFDCGAGAGAAPGRRPSRIIDANPCKPVSHIQYAARHGVWLLTFDSEEELSKVAQHHPKARLVLRLWAQDSESTFPLSAKFGAILEVCEHLLKPARALGLAVVRASFLVGSNRQTVRAFTQALADCRRVFEMGLLDIGGGFPGEEGCEPKRSERRTRGSLGWVPGTVCTCLHDFPVGSGVEIIAEPGRFFAGSVCMAAVNLIAKKAVLESGGHRKLVYYLSEGHLPQGGCPQDAPCGEEPPLFPCTLYGPTCDAFDKLFLGELQMPELDVGDWLFFPSMDTYTFTMSSTFNGFLPASVC